MSRTVDLINIGMQEEIANRVGMNGPQYISSSTGSAQSTATLIGGPNGANVISINASANAALTFSPTTEILDQYTLYCTGTVITIFTPVSTSGSWHTGSATTSFTIASGKSAIIMRAGPEPFPTGSIVSDRWIYTLSA